jgi:hypothetical protein
VVGGAVGPVVGATLAAGTPTVVTVVVIVAAVVVVVLAAMVVEGLVEVAERTPPGTVPGL